MKGIEILSWLQSHYPDTPEGRAVVSHMYELWLGFSPFADRNFADELCSGDQTRLHQRYWEMYLGNWLLDRRFELLPHLKKGPDIGVKLSGRNVWFEAVVPTPGQGNDRVPQLEFQPWKPGESLAAKEIPSNQILLRWATAFKEKSERFKEYMDAGIIGSSDSCVVAINSCEVHHFGFDGISGFPAAVEVVYPVGPIQVQWTIGQSEKTSSHVSYRPAVAKLNQSLVPTTSFLGDEFTHISGLLATDRNEWHKWSSPIEPMVMVHNLRSAIPIHRLEFPVDMEFRAELNQTGLSIHRDAVDQTI